MNCDTHGVHGEKWWKSTLNTRMSAKEQTILLLPIYPPSTETTGNGLRLIRLSLSAIASLSPGEENQQVSLRIISCSGQRMPLIELYRKMSILQMAGVHQFKNGFTAHMAVAELAMPGFWSKTLSPGGQSTIARRSTRTVCFCTMG